jgi:hypothetical protein
LLQDAVVPKTEHSPAKRFEIFGTTRVFIGIVLTAIGLDDQFRFTACEIRDVGSDRDLPPELEASDLPISEVAPKATLGVRRLSSQCQCIRIGSADRCHGDCLEEEKPSPNPLPLAGEGTSITAPASG